MNTAQFLIQQELAKAERNASYALGQVSTARTIQEIVRAANVQVPSLVHSLRHMVTSIKAVERTAESRIEAFIMERAKAIRAAGTPEDAKALQQDFMRKEASALRGKFARQYQFAERELLLALAAHAKHHKPVAREQGRT